MPPLSFEATVYDRIIQKRERLLRQLHAQVIKKKHEHLLRQLHADETKDLPPRPAPTDEDLELDHEMHLKPEAQAAIVCLYFLADREFVAHGSGGFEEIETDPPSEAA